MREPQDRVTPVTGVRATLHQPCFDKALNCPAECALVQVESLRQFCCRRLSHPLNFQERVALCERQSTAAILFLQLTGLNPLKPAQKYPKLLNEGQFCHLPSYVVVRTNCWKLQLEVENIKLHRKNHDSEEKQALFIAGDFSIGSIFWIDSLNLIPIGTYHL
jgi:hypothetical protein